MLLVKSWEEGSSSVDKESPGNLRQPGEGRSRGEETHFRGQPAWCSPEGAL